MPRGVLDGRLRTGGLSLVRAAAEAGSIARRSRTGHRAAVGTALGILAVGLAACGGSDSPAPPGDGSGPRVDAPLRLADCTDWKGADVSERIGTVRDLRAFAGGPTGSPAGHGAVLDDEQAYRLLQGYCENEFARAFKLYKLYTRAAAFAETARELQREAGGP